MRPSLPTGSLAIGRGGQITDCRDGTPPRPERTNSSSHPPAHASLISKDATKCADPTISRDWLNPIAKRAGPSDTLPFNNQERSNRQVVEVRIP